MAEKQHFTRAAEELFISQPAVSKQIHELENAIGQPLFNQIGRKIYLTETGQVLYKYAAQIFGLVAEAELALQDLADLQQGRLLVGASMTIGTYLLPKLLGEYKKLYPAIELSVDVANAEELQQKLLDNRLEIALIEGPVTAPELLPEIWQHDELVLIDSVTYPLIPEESLTLAQLLEKKLPFILREHGSGTRSTFDAALLSQNLTPLTPFLELNSLEAIKRAVAAGLGISFISEHTIRLEVQAGELRRVPLPDFTIRRPLHTVQLKNRKLSRPARAFLQLLQNPTS